MKLHETKVYLVALFLLFCIVLFAQKNVNGYYACGGSPCNGSYPCNGALQCNSSQVCGQVYDLCSGSTCVNGVLNGAGGWNQTTCNSVDCTNAGTTRTSIWVYVPPACAATCGTHPRQATCTDQAQNNCAQANCAAPTGVPGAVRTDNSCPCISEQPTKPVVTSVGNINCGKSASLPVVWTFGAAEGCGQAWGYTCGGNTNTFTIKVDGVVNTSNINSALRTYTISTTPIASHQVQVCSNNGFTENCSVAYTVTIDNSMPSAPVNPIPTFTPDGVCPDKYTVGYSWSAPSDVGCAGLNAAPYWSQASTSNTFVSTDFPINTWGSYTSQTTSTAYVPGTPIYLHVQARDALDNQTGWPTPLPSVIVPSPSPYPTIMVSGSFVEDVGVPSGTTCVANLSLNPLSLILQPTISPSNGVTADCAFTTATTYKCNIAIDNQQGACVSPSINIAMGGSYSGYGSLGWRSGGICSGAGISYNMNIGTTQDAPLFFQYAGGSGGGGGGGGGGGAGGSGGWFKLKDGAFNSRLSGRQNFIPNTISLFDTAGEDSIANRNMMIGNAGIIVQNSPVDIGASSTTYSQKNWYTNTYLHSDDVSYLKYLDYVKSRKDYATITDITEITNDGIYSIASDVILSANQFDGKKVVLVVTGGKKATFNADFVTTGSVAVLASTIEIDSTVGQINAILIGETVTAGSSNTGLKIKGNLIDQTVFLLDRTQTDARKPSMFVIFDMQLYLNLLPYLSTSTYDWKQIQ